MGSAKGIGMKKIFLAFAGMVAVLGIVFFVPAGTFDYWQAWVYIAVVFFFAAFVVAYFLRYDPQFLDRRLRFKEKEATQKSVINASYFIFLVGFLLPGLDRRFGWSNVPLEVVLVADAFVLLGYALCFQVMRENRYAVRTVEVMKGQKVITTGAYSVVRHPFYVGQLLLFLATPIALGSYWALLPFLLMVPLMVFRILNEEEVLRRGLKGYKEYCKKTKYRLVPFVW